MTEIEDSFSRNSSGTRSLPLLALLLTLLETVQQPRSRHHRERSRSRSRSPAPRSHHHRERSRSRSPRRSRSPVRKMDTDVGPPRDSRSDRDRSDRDHHRDSRDSRDHHHSRDSRDPLPSRGGGDSRREPFDPARKAINREYAASEAAKKSRKECRVYVGNLAFGVKWNDLKDFMREGGLYSSSHSCSQRGRSRVELAGGSG